MEGDYVKILKKGKYEGQIGKIKNFDGLMFYKIKLLNVKETINCLENEIEKTNEKLVPEKENFIVFPDGTKNKLKDQDLTMTCECLVSNNYFKGLYALGKYYSNEAFEDEPKNDYLRNLIFNIKNHNLSSAKYIVKMFLDFINKSEILKKIINNIDYIIMMPSVKNFNHVHSWGKELITKLNKIDLSDFFYVSREKENDLLSYKYKKDWQRSKIMEGAFKIKNDPDILSEIRGKNCLILDDICTTGSQINELTNKLVQAGINEVYAFVIARTAG